MNWVTRNLIVLVFGTLVSVLVVASLLYLEADGGDLIFGANAQTLSGLRIAVLNYIPVGAIGAGLAAGFAFFAAAVMLRLRPAGISTLVILVLSAGLVYMAESAELEMYIGNARGVTASRGKFTHFLLKSVAHSHVELWGVPDWTDSTTSMFAPGTAPVGPRLQASGDNKVGSISAGVSGMMATQDMTQTGPGKQLNQMSQNVQSVGADIQAHYKQWFVLAFQTLGFAAGSLWVILYLRTLEHCKGCMLLLNKKGEATRYFSRTREMQHAVDVVMTKARDKQLQESIHEHITKGAEKKANWAQFSSTIAIHNCTQCNTHKLDFHAARREGSNWKEISLLAFSATTLDPLDFA